ncbi:ubiquitin-conjugating enzyme E2-binding protein [Microdochium trichocladiopsis]|uniref:Ubiquitin-conjugating enzyme E2-binding protein n=1 Tax=Microdochium trichocladiopsis TaxID=1682393 RepID=A0A9P8Y4D5_9PEZI|nr:ubiquitin-conjugating enzyme E2-binding protein [Microdochium trichocladiopsis]KAH7030967.1 ubiquitin-conjugating enzyme E2-binding protein [Microdochium trichocladiopsis]
MAQQAEAASMLLYAELLPNIRQISVGCLLPSPSLPQTQIAVSPDGTKLTVQHDGGTTSLQLPGRAQPGLKPPVREGQTCITFRLPVPALDGTTGGFVRPTSESQAVPWSATEIAPRSAVACRKCESVLVQEGTLSTWKDLPSENWAEMMEFWHCHKPHDHKKDGEDHGHDHLASTRGYGASARIAAQPGLGFVDLTSLLIATTDVLPNTLVEPLGETEPDEQELESENTPVSNTQTLATCRLCQSRLGVITRETNSVSFFKWQVIITTAAAAHSARLDKAKVPTLSHCVSAMLLATLGRTGCSKSILMPIKTSPSTTTSHKLLHVWLFNGNIKFSSSVAGETGSVSGGPQAAVKVLFKLVSEAEADKLLHALTSDTQDISLPADAIETTSELLQESNGYLPPSERTFKEWSVGLVSRWEE